MAVNIGPRIGIDGEREYRKQVNELITQQKTFSAQMKELESAFDSSTSAMEKNRKKADLLKDAIANQEKTVEELEKGLEESTKKYGENSTQTQKWKQAVANAKTELNKLNSELSSLPNSLQAVGKKMQSVGNKMQKAGGKLTKYVSGPIAGIGVASIKMAMDAETSFAKVRTIIDETVVSYDDLQKGVIQASNDTGVAIEDFNEALYSSLSAGVESGKAIEFTTDMVKLAKGGFTDTSKAVDVVTTVLNAYGLSADEAAAVSDKLVTTQNLGKTTVDELAGSLGKIIPTAKAANVDFDQVATSMAILTQRGISTNESATYLNAMLGELSKSGSDVDKVLREKTGKSFSELEEAGVPLNEILAILNDTAIADGESLGDLFSQQTASKAALTIMADDGKAYVDVLDQMGASAGATDEAMQTMAQTSEEKLKKAINNARNISIKLGGTPALDTAEKKVEELSNWFTSLDENSQKRIGNIVAALAFGGPAVKAGGTLVSAAGKAVSAVGGIATKVGELTGATSGLETAASALAGAGGPILAVAATVGWAAFVVKSMSSDVEASNEDIKDLIKAQEENVKALDGAMKAVDEALSSGNESIQAVNDQADMALGIVDELEKLEAQSSRTAEEEAHMQSLIGQLNSMYPDLKVGIDKSTGSLNKSTKEIKNYIKNAKQMALLEAYTRASSEAMDALVKANNELYNAEKGQAALKKAREEAALTRNALIGLQTQTGSTAYTGKIQDLANDINALDREIEDGQVAIDDYKVAVSTAESECASWGEQMEQLSTSAEETTESTEDLTGAVEDHGNKSENASKKINELVSSMGEEGATAVKARDDAVQAWDDMYNATRESIQGQIRLFDEWQQDSEITFDKVLKNMKKNRRGIENYATNLQTLADAAVASGDARFMSFVQYIADMGVEGAAYAQAMVDQLDKDKDEFNRIWREYGKDTGAMDALTEVATYIGSDFMTKTQAGARAFNSAIDTMGSDSIMGRAVSRVKTNATNIVNSLFGLADDADKAGKKTGANLEAGYAGLEGTAKTAAEKASKASKEVIDNTDYDPEVDKVDVPESVTKTATTTIENNIKPTVKVSGFSLNDALTNAKSIMQSFFDRNPIIAKLRSGGVTQHAYGGFTDEEQLSWLSEGNKPEVVIPLSSTLRSRALDLFSQTGDILGVDTIPKERGSITMPVNPYTAPSELKFDTEKLYEAIAQGAAAGMESANVKIYWNDREAGRIMRDMGVQFA